MQLAVKFEAMARKITDGPVRNKERTKLNLLRALGKILKKNGFSGLSITSVADEAKVDRRLIYGYFGGLEGMVKEYLNSHDYWKMNPDEIDAIVQASQADAGKGLAYSVLENQFDSLINNEEMRRIITWGLIDKMPALKELDLKRENMGDQLLSAVSDHHFKETEKNFRAMYAILMGGVYYLTLHAKMQENPFCGIDLLEAKGQEQIKKALKDLLDLIYAY
jgi:AcrR family transcriptional regulator